MYDYIIRKMKMQYFLEQIFAKLFKKNNLHDIITLSRKDVDNE